MDYESRGVKPPRPHPYFESLLNGKKWWEWQLNEIAATYGTGDWWGWATLEQDYADDLAGLKQIVQRVKQQWKGLTYQVPSGLSLVRG